MCEVKSLMELEDVGVLKLGRGKIISKKDLAASPGNFPVYSSSKVGEGKFGEYGLYMFDEELITWSVDGGGRLFHREKHKFSITNVTGFIRILDESVLSYKYLYYALSLLHSKINFDWVKKAHPSVLRKEYKHIPIPPLAEQQRIVAKLDAAFAEIDVVIEVAEAKEAEVEKLKASLLSASLSADAVMWESVKLKDIALIKGGKRIPKGKKLTDAETPFPYLRVSDFGDNGTIDISNLKYVPESVYPEIKNYTIHSDDVYISIAGTIGKVGIVPDMLDGANLTENAAKLVLGDNCFNKYIALVLSSQHVTEQIKESTRTAAQPKLSLRRMGEISIALPPLAEQQRIVAKLDAAFAEIDSAKQAIQQTKENHAALKAAILAQELAPPTESEAA